MEFLSIDNSKYNCNITPLEVYVAASFYKGMVAGQIERDIPLTFIIMIDDENNTCELITMDSCPGFILDDLDESMNDRGWRPVAVEFCEDDEDFTLIDLHYFPEPTDEDIALVENLFKEKI
jgi:hypothetical protein